MPAPIEATLAGVPCAYQVWRTLQQWDAGTDFLEGPPTADGARTVRFPTGTLAEWVVLTLPVDDTPSLIRVTPERASARTYAEDCSSQLQERRREPVSTDTTTLFTDAHLRARIDGWNEALVIYVWAPHMPLSVDGYAEVREAAETLGLRVVPVLMAHSDLSFATREAGRVGIPAEGLRQIDSNELVQRQAQVHAPSIVVFSRDRVSPVLPGYRNSEGYRRFLEVFLDQG